MWSRYKSISGKGYLNNIFVGDYSFECKSYEKSLKFYDLALKINPECFEAYLNKGYFFLIYIGKAHSILKNYDDAHCMLDKA